VPLIVRWPGLTSPGACGAAIYQLDLAPTLCELLGVEPPAGWDGRSFAAALRGGQVDERPHLLFGQGAWCVQRAVLQGRRLYIRTIFPGLDPMPAELLFDLDSDPHEERNLGSDPDLAALLGELTPDPDPLRRILAEGGPLYPRLARDAYLNRLRETGRTAIAEQLAGRPLAPVVDPFDLTRV
jgi:arylsulfatase A-like enzyme